MDKLYVMPFELGLEWKTTPFAPDTSYVSAIETLLIVGNTYEDVAKIERSTWGFNYSLEESHWIKPGIGLAKYQIHRINLGAQIDETWELIDFHIQSP